MYYYELFINTFDIKGSLLHVGQPFVEHRLIRNVLVIYTLSWKLEAKLNKSHFEVNILHVINLETVSVLLSQRNIGGTSCIVRV